MSKRIVVITHYPTQLVNFEFIRPTFGEIGEQAEQYELGDLIGGATRKRGNMVVAQFEHGNIVYAVDV